MVNSINKVGDSGGRQIASFFCGVGGWVGARMGRRSARKESAVGSARSMLFLWFFFFVIESDFIY